MQERSCFKTAVMCLLAFLLPVAVMFILYRVYHFAPFGNQSLAWMDGNINHIQYFAFLKDVLSGNNQISYTLSHCLGGTYIASFSMSLSSPFNLLLKFFEKEELHSFFDLLIALKLGAAGGAMAFYLSHRFKLSVSMILPLSLGYALSQYCIAQSSLIFWHDGVYLLPLILLGVYNVIQYNRTLLLSISVGLSLIFNWYTGCINCLFSTIWFCFEFALAKERLSWGGFWGRGVRYGFAMASGVMLSACLFLPTLVELFNGAAGRSELGSMQFTLRGNPISAISAFSIGACSTPDCVSLFCGSAVLLGCLGILNSKLADQKERNIFIIMLLFVVLLFYWQPFYFLFSLLLPATSFWFRYSYVGIFALIFIAAHFYQRSEDSADTKLLSACLIWCIIILALDYARPGQNTKNIYTTLVFMFGIVGCYLLRLKVRQVFLKKFIGVLLLVVSSFEMGRSTRQLMRIYYTGDVVQYKNYVFAAQKQLNLIKELDSSLYRISQNTPRNSAPNGLTAYYNEPVAFNYNSMCGYTSTPDGRSLSFLNSLGYRIEAQRITIVNTSILAADALLGVKYYISAYPINGLEPLPLEKANNKRVYHNKFALPMAFVFKPAAPLKGAVIRFDGNPFVYQNALYSQLLGEKVELYQPVTYESKVQGKDVDYTLAVPSGKIALYGNIPWYRDMDAEIVYEGKRITPYSRWLSPSVFYIPMKSSHGGGDLKLIRLTLKTKNGVFVKKEQFYALDLERLEKVTQRLQLGTVAQFVYDKQDLEASVQGKKGQYLYLSFPYHNGWTILRNGKKVEPELFGNCMMTIPLLDGENIIQGHFTVPGLKAGIIITIMIALGLLTFCKRDKYIKICHKKQSGKF